MPSGLFELVHGCEPAQRDGIVANAPHEAVKFLDQKFDCITVLSIGTTTSKFSLPAKAGREFGQKAWLEGQRLVSTVISSQQQLVDFMLKHQLGDRYVRFDELPSAEQLSDLGLDLATEGSRRTRLGLANGCYQICATTGGLSPCWRINPQADVLPSLT